MTLTQVLLAASIPADTTLIEELRSEGEAGAAPPPIHDGDLLLWTFARLRPAKKSRSASGSTVNAAATQTTFVSQSNVRSDQTPLLAGPPIEHILQRPTAISWRRSRLKTALAA